MIGFWSVSCGHVTDVAAVDIWRAGREFKERPCSAAGN